MDRQPVVAGQFYPGRGGDLDKTVLGYLAPGSKRDARTILAMVPHAGYIYSGGVAGKTLGMANLANRILLLGPNHTGLGRPLSLWPDGSWLLPGGAVPVDAELASALMRADSRLEPDPRAHVQEHSLEVVLPFLRLTNPDARIVPLAVAETRARVLEEVASNVAGLLKGWPEPVSIVVSSDMSHYISHDAAKQRDGMALEAIEAMDPSRLYETVREHGITMCGVMPMVLGLSLAKELGATTAEVAAYSTSGEASGDYRRVVGYAGVLVS